MKSLKKAFSSFVSLTTILWSVGGTLAFPSVASAATLNSGDLIKASTAAVYYYAADGKRYVFPNEKTYFTWYSNFSSVKTITDAELAAIQIGGNVTYRPGVKMVKITTDPKVYAVAVGGVLRHVPSEACATTIYGSTWNKMIEDVPDGFFVNYTVGSPIPADCSGYDKAAEMAASPTINADLGAAPSTSSGNVSVSLASDTPAGITSPKNAASVPLLKVNFAAGSETAKVTGLKIRHLGVGATSDFSNVYLYDGNGNRLTTGRTINSSSNMVEFNGLNISVPANSTVSVVLVGDFAGSSISATGGQHAFEVTDAASVVSGGSISGSFPARGNTFTVGTQSAGELDVLKGTTPTNPTVGTVDAEISNFKLTANTNDIEVRRITLLQAGDVSNTDLSDLKLYQGSTLVASAAALMGDKIVLNFSPAFVIEDGQTKTFSLKAKVAGRSSRTIKTYVEYTTDVYAVDKLYNSGAAIDIGGSNGTFDGTSTNYIEVTTQGGTLTVAFNGPATGNIAKGSQDVKLFRFALTSSETDLEVRKLRVRIDSTTGGQLETGSTDYFTDIKIVNADTGTTLMGSSSLPASAASGTAFIFTESFPLPAGTTVNLAVTADLANSSATDFVGESYRVCLSDDSASAVAAGTAVSTVCASGDKIFQEGDVKVMGTGENLALTKIVPNAAISGNAQTVRASSLDVALASSPSASTAVKNQAKVPAVGIVFTAGNESNMMIRSVKLTGSADLNLDGTGVLADLNNVASSCALYDGETQVGTSESPDETTGAMTITGVNVTVPAGSSKTLVAKCSIASVIDGAEDRFAIGIAADADVTAEDKDNNDVSAAVTTALEANAALTGQGLIQVVKSSGTLTVSAGNQPSSNLVVGGNWVKLAEYTAAAQFEDAKIERIAVTSTGDAANFTSVAVRVAGADKGTNILPAGTNKTVDVDLSASPITVAKDSTVGFELWGQLRNTQPSSTVNGATSGAARSGNSLSLGVNAAVTTGEWSSDYSSSFNVKAFGSASGERLLAAGSSASMGNAMVLRKTKPTITKLAVSTNTLSSGSPTDLYKFQVTPDAGGEVRWKQIVFTVTTSSGTTTSLNNFQFFRGATQLTAGTQVQIFDGQNNDVTGSTNMGASSTNVIIVKMVTEEVVSGSGTTYTLRATPTVTGSGNTVSVQLSRTATSVGSATGYLAQPAGSGQLMSLDTATAFDGTGDANGYFLWSDVSEPAGHSYTTSTPSRDWTNDVYVEDMTQSQVFTKN